MVLLDVFLVSDGVHGASMDNRNETEETERIGDMGYLLSCLGTELLHIFNAASADWHLYRQRQVSQASRDFSKSVFDGGGLGIIHAGLQ